MTPWTALDVRCSTCGASPGVSCRRLTDASRIVTPAHQARRRAAREAWALLNPEHVRGQQALFARKDVRP